MPPCSIFVGRKQLATGSFISQARFCAIFLVSSMLRLVVLYMFPPSSLHRNHGFDFNEILGRVRILCVASPPACDSPRHGDSKARKQSDRNIRPSAAVDELTRRGTGSLDAGNKRPQWECLPAAVCDSRRRFFHARIVFNMPAGLYTISRVNNRENRCGGWKAENATIALAMTRRARPEIP